MDVDLSAPTQTAPDAPGSGGPAGGHPARTLAFLGAALVVAAGVVLRFCASSDLWLDEALTVSIARLPLDRLQPALAHDGAPPLFYVLLHGWMEVFGTSTTAVRALSGVLGVLAIGLAYLAARVWVPDGRRGRVLGTIAAVVVASSPYAIHYSTEVRMYALSIVLGLLGIVLAAGAWRAPTPVRLAGIAVVVAGSLYTQYWAFFLVGVVALGLVLAVVLGPAPVTRRARRLLVAVLAGCVLFLPWWPTFTSQLAHTGTPWDGPAGLLASSGRAWLGFGGTGWLRWVVASVLTGLVLFGSWRARGVERTVGRLAAALGVATVLVGIVASAVGDTGFEDRYAAVAFPFLALAVAFGAGAITDVRLRAAVLVVLAGTGLVAGLRVVRADRTASTGVAAALRPALRAGDVVAYCPDQLGPSTARLLPGGVVQLTFPRGDAPDLVDWTDYADRNAAASPTRFARAVVARAGTGRVFVVWSGGYRTLGTKCEQTVNAVQAIRPHAVDVTVADGPAGEQVGVKRFDP
jgi:hypothetical protein